MKLDHLGIAVKSIDEAVKFYQQALGLSVAGTETVQDQKVRVAMLPIGESRLELLEATSSDSPIAKFIDKRGPGIHHICIEVEDIYAKLDELKAAGVDLIDSKPRIGAGGHLIAFVHPKSSSGVLIELVQKEAEH
ncbi:MAG: methylmalonyl-CoA epimerase [Acidobacteriota bacterium]|nr:methylmalonyl-CoA epimerase [Blastocatellia bacterium]MDW8411294.1 methylmalonyl-CoA epimerase [Acidobacteriota bacterium]